MSIGDYLALPFAQHALIASTLVAVTCGLVGPFVTCRNMAFAVHASAELAFTGAAAGLLVAGNAVGGALAGAIVVAALIAVLTTRRRERDSAIGVVLAAGLALGVLLLGYYHGFATEATNILFGDIFGVSTGQIVLLAVIAAAATAILTVIHRPLLFASVDPEVAAARGLATGLLGLTFLVLLAFTVTEAAQVVGTLLVLSLAITPAASAQRLAAGPLAMAGLSVAFAVLAADGGLILSLQSGTVKPSVLVASISFALYLGARLAGPGLRRRHRARRVGVAGVADPACPVGPACSVGPAGPVGPVRPAGSGRPGGSATMDT